MKIASWKAIMILLCSTAASDGLASTTYLTCSLDGLPPDEFGFTMNEASGTVGVHIRSSGHSRVVPAVYAPDMIVITERGVRWTINRVNFKFTRTITAIESTGQGLCKLENVPRRAF